MLRYLLIVAVASAAKVSPSAPSAVDPLLDAEAVLLQRVAGRHVDKDILWRTAIQANIDEQRVAQEGILHHVREQEEHLRLLATRLRSSLAVLDRADNKLQRVPMERPIAPEPAKRTCSHTRCSLAGGGVRGSGARVTVEASSLEQHGDRHECRMGTGRRCECVCWALAI